MSNRFSRLINLDDEKDTSIHASSGPLRFRFLWGVNICIKHFWLSDKWKLYWRNDQKRVNRRRGMQLLLFFRYHTLQGWCIQFARLFLYWFDKSVCWWMNPSECVRWLFVRTTSCMCCEWKTADFQLIGYFNRKHKTLSVLFVYTIKSSHACSSWTGKVNIGYSYIRVSWSRRKQLSKIRRGRSALLKLGTTWWVSFISHCDDIRFIDDDYLRLNSVNYVSAFAVCYVCSRYFPVSL